MKSETLNFELYDDLKFFDVEFESESRERNIIMKIEYDGFLLDTVQLEHTHHKLYAKLFSKMKRKAGNYWDEQTIKVNV